MLSNVTKSVKFLRRPGAGGALHGVPDGVQCFEPAVGRSLIADAPPDALLQVEGGLIGGQVVQSQPRVGAQELLDRGALVPSCAIDIEADAVALEAPVEME